MRLADADRTGEEQTFAGGVDGIGLDEFARGEMSPAQRLIGAVKGGFVAIERVLAIALGDAGRGEAALFAIGFLALAGAGDPEAGVGDDADKTYAVADWDNTLMTFSSLAQWARARCGGKGVQVGGKGAARRFQARGGSSETCSWR